jgi:hypothetical protein
MLFIEQKTGTTCPKEERNKKKGQRGKVGKVPELQLSIVTVPVTPAARMLDAVEQHTPMYRVYRQLIRVHRSAIFLKLMKYQ